MIIYTSKGFQEIAKGTPAPKGCYICWTLSGNSARQVAEWAQYMGVPEVVIPDDMHATIMYSKTRGLPEEAHGINPLQIPVSINHWQNPHTKILGKPNSSGALVTGFDSNILANRHRFWRDNYGLEHSFPDFFPHVTLSYNAAQVPREVLSRLMVSPCGIPLSFVAEKITYCE